MEIWDLHKKNNNSEEELNSLSALIRRELEVLVIRTVEKSIKPILEPLICRIVKKEVESAKEKISTNMNRNRGNEMQPSESRSLQLRFSSKISQPVMTGERIKGEKCDSIEVVLVDVLSEQVVTSGPLASAKVEMVVLKGDFDTDEHDWTIEEFNKNIVIDMEGKIMNGKMCLNLKEGVGVLDEISFKHSSTWKKACELRLGARVVDNPNGIRVREAKTERFTLKDRRNYLYKKHHPPSLNDEVWRLENIGQDGAFHKRLSGEKVNTAEDFLKLLFLDPERLRDILGKSMSNKRWEVTVDHAQTCLLDGKLYFYCPPGSQEQTGVVFSIVGQLMGLLSECHYDPIDKLSETEKADAHNMVKSAFEHWGDVVSFDDDAYLMDGSSGLSNVHNPSPSISSKRASSDGDKILSCHKKARFEYPRTSVFTLDITPSILSMVFRLHSLRWVNIRCAQTPSFPVSQTFCKDGRLQDFDADIACQSQSSSWDSHSLANLHSALNGSLLARSTPGDKAQRILRVLKRFSVRRIVARRKRVWRCR